MDKSILKSFATEAREELIEKIKLKAIQYGIKEGKIEQSSIISSDSIVINGKPLSIEEKNQRARLVEKIELINEKGEDGYKQVIEEVAYTWFNRFIALRFMEVNDYLPTRIRVLTSSNPESKEPDILREANNVNLEVDKQKIYEYKLNSDIEGLFKYMIIAQCDALNKPLPFMFEKIDHYTQLLFPDGLLNDKAFISRLTSPHVIKEDWWTNVEIIGWFYQYYIANEKDRVIKAKKKYKKDEIPFATQLFTPDWIVRYMVQNSLGRYWVESHPEDSDLKAKWEFYLENPNPEPDFEEKLAPYINKELRVEDIKCFDPACGSGHILVYMFDVLYEIYEKCGYTSREIPQLILENNLYGLDIDDRAYQLACFAVVMRGMNYHNRLLRDIERQVDRTGDGINLNIASIQETNEFNNDDIVYLAGESEGEKYNKVKSFIDLFYNAKTYGSLIKIEATDIKFIEERFEYIKTNPVNHTVDQISKNKFINNDSLKSLVKQYKIMKRTYDILVTNPPYMGSNYMNQNLSEFIKANYPDVKADIFSAFIKYCLNKVNNTGHLGFLSPFVWMFLSAYSSLRNRVIEDTDISTMIQLEYNAFPEACVPVCSFTLRKYRNNFIGEYIRLSDFPGVDIQESKVLEAVNNSKIEYRYQNTMSNYEGIPNKPIAYWISKDFVNLFKYKTKIKDLGQLKSGTSTSGQNNELFRFWYEVNNNDIEYTATNYKNVKNKWLLMNKGGSYRRWYGNLEYVCNNIFCPKNDNEFDLAITWSDINSHYFSARVHEKGVIANNVGKRVYVDQKYYNYILGFLNTVIAEEMLDLIIPTLHFDVGYVGNLPVIIPNTQDIEYINNIVNENIEISKEEWDLFELSMNFNKHPFLKYNSESRIESAFEHFSAFTKTSFDKLKRNEEDLNNKFIEIYGLKRQVQINEKDITLRVANTVRDIKAFISYAVGCIVGRYSLDEDGVVYSGGEFDLSSYESVSVDEDNIIPILLEGYFEDDIVKKFVEFVGITFGEDTLNENIDFIAETLGKKSSESSKDAIRRYFLNDFFKDHKQMYKNRPIYWLFTSGKQKAFNCLIYMHRYDETTLSRIRTDYLHELQDRLDAERKSIMEVVDGDYTAKEKSNAKKEVSILDKKIDELKAYDELLHHMADMQIKIDLDDGVVVNYDKFKGLLAKL